MALKLFKDDLPLWTKNLIHDRQQRVTIGDSSPNWITVTRCIPKGSVSDPIMFLYIHVLMI